MRIVNWDEFQTLPEGTIFQSVDGGCLGDLMILGNFYRDGEKAIDILEAGLTPGWQDDTSMGEAGRKHLNVAPGQRVDFFVTPQGFGRDGMFDYDRSWLIWEDADRERLAAWLLDPGKAVEAMNDEAHAHVAIPWPDPALPKPDDA